MSREIKKQIRGGNMPKKITYCKVFLLGMELEEWCYKTCIAHFGVGEDWATLYDIESKDQGKGHATALLTRTKKYYEKQGKCFGGSVALNPAMAKIYKKLGIHEYID